MGQEGYNWLRTKLFPGKYRPVFPSQPDAEVSIALVVIVQPPPLDLEEGTIPKDLKDDIVKRHKTLQK